MDYLFFYVPFCYVYKIRMKTFFKMFGMFSYHIIPVAYYFLLTTGWSINNIFNFVLAITIFYCLYEIGYIQNDIKTILKETNPTKRLSDDQENYGRNNYLQIFFCRLCIAFILLVILFYSLNSTIGYFYFALSLAALLVVFWTYNQLRNNYSLIVFFILQVLKYVPFILIGIKDFNINLLLLLVLIYPVPNSIERLSFHRYKIYLYIKCLPRKEHFTEFRVVYYISLTLIFMIMDFMGILSLRYYVVFIYLLFFRVAVFWLTRKKNISFIGYNS